MDTLEKNAKGDNILLWKRYVPKFLQGKALV